MYHGLTTPQMPEKCARQPRVSASTAQADAARRSLDLVFRQLEKQASIGRTIIKTAIQAAINSIEYWRAQNCANLTGNYSLPGDIKIVPSAARAVQHARAISIRRCVSMKMRHLA